MASEFPRTEEIEIAEIVLQLPELILGKELHSRVAFTWGSRRRRSDASTRENNNDTVVVTLLSPPPPPIEVKAEASSPATPLSFPPSESDSKRKSHFRHNKRKREELLKTTHKLTQQKDLMMIEIEKVRSYYEKLKIFNLQLKAKKEELINTGLKKETSELKMGGQINDQLHPRPSIQDQMVQVSSSDDNEGPRGIPDLNISIEESLDVCNYQPLDFAMANRNLSKAMASEARRRRIEIKRVKKLLVANKQCYSYI